MSRMMETITKEILKPKTKNNLLSFSVKRSVTGVDVFVKSDIFYNFFEKYGDNRYDEVWSGNKAFSVPIVKDHFRNLLSHWFGNLMVNGYPNLAFLRSTSLREGATFELDNQVYTRGEIMDFSKRFKEEVVELFTEYVKPITMEVELITEVREE